jgi:hypothetical protein
MAVAPDFPMSSLPAAGGGLNKMSGLNRSSIGMGLGRKPVQSIPMKFVGANGWEGKVGVQTHVMPMHQNGSTVW